MLLELHAHEQTAIRSSIDAEVTRRGDFARNQVLGNGIEIVVDTLAMGLESGLMPRRPELASSANVGQYEDSATLQPELANAGIVERGIGNLEAAIRGHHSGIVPVVGHVFGVNDKIGNAGTILGR